MLLLSNKPIGIVCNFVQPSKTLIALSMFDDLLNISDGTEVKLIQSLNILSIEEYVKVDFVTSFKSFAISPVKSNLSKVPVSLIVYSPSDAYVCVAFVSS